jgi:hypothetical protein
VEGRIRRPGIQGILSKPCAIIFYLFIHFITHQTYKSFFRIWICSRTALLLVPPVAFFSSTARS